MVGDGTLGWRPYAPYDAIVVAAASPGVPEPLMEQLADGGRLVIPIGTGDKQALTLVETRPADTASPRPDVGDVRFVPLLGATAFET